MKSMETSIEINASPERVWAVFSDFASYPEWSAFIESMEGQLQEGSGLLVSLKPPGKAKATIFKPRVLTVTPNKEFRWLGKLGGLGFLFTGEHYFKLEAVGDRTRFVHGEQFKGILVPVLGKLLADTKKGFEAYNQALKERVETL